MSIDDEIEIGRGRTSDTGSDKIPAGLLRGRDYSGGSSDRNNGEGHYHASVKPGSRAKNLSAKAHADYIAREGRYGGEERASDLEYVEHGNMPEWAQERPAAFWEAADTYERTNARLYTEFELSLPRELNPEQRMTLIHGFVAEHIGDRHPYTFAVHNPAALDGQEQPHVHLMFTERRLDGIERSPEHFFKRKDSKHPERGGAGKDRDWNRRDKIKELRESWAIHLNQSFDKAGVDFWADHRSLKEQGIDRKPEPKMGRSRTAMLKKGKTNELTATIMELRELHKTIEKAEQGLISEAKRPDPTPEKPTEATKPEAVHVTPPAPVFSDRVQQLIEEGQKLTEQAKTKTRGMKVKERREHELQLAERGAQFEKQVKALKREITKLPDSKTKKELLLSIRTASRAANKGKGFER